MPVHPAMPRRGRTVVDIESIVPDPRNERKRFAASRNSQKRSNALGIIEPPTVVPLEDGRLHAHHR